MPFFLRVALGVQRGPRVDLGQGPHSGHSSRVLQADPALSWGLDSMGPSSSMVLRGSTSKKDKASIGVEKRGFNSVWGLGWKICLGEEAR